MKKFGKIVLTCLTVGAAIGIVKKNQTGKR